MNPTRDSRVEGMRPAVSRGLRNTNRGHIKGRRDKGHYSNQMGHKARGEAARNINALEQFLRRHAHNQTGLTKYDIE